MLKRFVSASVLVVLVHAMASGADAFTSDKRTYFTFNQSVALPGVTLPAGTYMFRLADPDTTRRVIQVSDKEGTQSYALLLTMPAYRPTPPRTRRFASWKRPQARRARSTRGGMSVTAPAIEFMYSKQQLAELNRVGQPEPVAAAA